VAYVTQTTLSTDETQDIVMALRQRYPQLIGPDRDDICYATQNRQDAVKSLVAHGIAFLLVVGSANSSNSRRLCEVAANLNVPSSLIDGPGDLPLSALASYDCLGLTAGASAPEHLVQAVADLLRDEGWHSQELEGQAEDVKFKLPKELARLTGH
jgi:4-hydroxy-3-methylbut-2-enyl diphosphate reductase